jgi:hypothetical protein
MDVTQGLPAASACSRLVLTTLVGRTLAVFFPTCRTPMSRTWIMAAVAAVVICSFVAPKVRASPSGTAEEAKAMLEKAVAAVRADKTKALEMFNNGEGGFKERDLYVSCANALDGSDIFI